MNAFLIRTDFFSSCRCIIRIKVVFISDNQVKAAVS